MTSRPTCRSSRPMAAPASTATWPRSSCSSWKAAATRCTGTWSWTWARSTAGRSRPSHSASTGRPETGYSCRSTPCTSISTPTPRPTCASSPPTPASTSSSAGTTSSRSSQPRSGRNPRNGTGEPLMIDRSALVAERTLDPEVEQEYEIERVFVRAIASTKYSLSEERARMRSVPRVYKTSNFKWRGGPQVWHKNILNPSMGIMQTLQASYEELAPGSKSQRHGHQNSALLFVLEGKGYDISDGERVDWEEGDVCFVAPGTVHQHFNSDPEKPARVLIVKTKPVYNFANLNFQEFKEKAPKDAVAGFQDYFPEE